MKNQISERLAALREVMREEHLAAFIFPSTDPHNSEYVPDRWKGREWISGFDGSAGTAVVTMTSAALWTDSRYFIAAEEQLSGTEFQLMKMKVAGTPSIPSWLGAELRDSDSTEIGVDGSCMSAADVENLIQDMRKNGGITVRTNMDLLEKIWTDRPKVPSDKIEIYPTEYAGERCASKLQRIRQALREQHADGMLVAALDDIAWTTNLRGNDVHCNPVFVSYLLIATNKATLFVDKAKLSPEVIAYLKGEGVETADYSAILKGIDDYFEYNILLDPNEINYTLFQAASKHKIVAAPSPIPVLKAVKNESEVRGFKQAMLADGIAMTKFLRWLKPAVEQGNQTELSVSNKLEQLRSEQKNYKGLSFDTISAYQAHGAIVHYEPTCETDIPLKPEGFLLLDSGAQYLGGTTDITRTIALGDVTAEQRLVYTLVLKGHIQLELAKFPDGVAGTQIDALAREPLWREGLNFLHGTGHGVGAYLNVHEGPHQVRMEWKPTPLRAGMTITDEPGVYLENRFGVRIENTLLIVPYLTTEMGDFLQMESLTLCPIDTEPILLDRMTQEEIDWLNAYHQTVYQTLAPSLEDADREWLAAATKPIEK